jgi:hypothetical protein
MAIATGTYEMLPLLDVTLALDVTSNSVANRANVRLWGRNGSNGQKWDLSAQNGYYTIRDAETGKSLDVANGTAAKGSNVWMYNFNNSTAQHWVITEVGTQTVNGTAYPVVTIGAFGGTSFVLDVAGGSAAKQTNVQIWTPNGTAAQRWVLYPTEWLAETVDGFAADGAHDSYYDGLPTPASGTRGTTQGTTRASVMASVTGTMLPAWTCSEPLYQVAYRTRTRASGADWLSGWSSWKSIADGSTAFGGFGAPGASNCSPALVGGRRWSPNGVTYDNGSAYDRTDVQVAVRAWRAQWGATHVPAHGPTYTYTTTIVRPVAITALDVLLAPDGITVAWESTATHDGNAITLDCVAWGSHATTGAADGSTTILQRDISRMPRAGETVSVHMSMLTPDGLTATYDAIATVGYDGSHGTSLALTAAPHATDPTLQVVTASDADARAWLVVDEGHGTRFVPIDGASPWTVAPPLNCEWSVYASVASGTSWESKMQTFDPVADDGWHVTSQDLSKDFAVRVNEGAAPKANPSFTRSVGEVEVMGRERPVYTPNESTEVAWTLEGLAYGEDIALYDWAVHAGHVIFRSPWGEWRQAVVTSGSLEHVAVGVAKVTLAMGGEVW